MTDNEEIDIIRLPVYKSRRFFTTKNFFITTIVFQKCFNRFRQKKDTDL